MARFEHSIEVSVPLRTAYNQWTQFEEFPYFMEGVKSVEQKTDTILHWVAEIAGRTEEWDAEITEQRPDNRISWQSISGARHTGLVTFHYLAPNKTLVMAVIDYDPNGFIENVGAALGIVQRRMAGDLKRFKEFIESRGYETGGWRGEVNQYENAQPFGKRYTETAALRQPTHATSTTVPFAAYTSGSTSRTNGHASSVSNSTGSYARTPSLASQPETPGKTEERGERNELGDNSFTSSENPTPEVQPKRNDNWSTSTTPTTPSSAPLNDIGNSSIAPGQEPAHSFGAVEDEPQGEASWEEDTTVHNPEQH